MSIRVQARPQQSSTPAQRTPAPAPVQALTPEQMRAVVGGSDLQKAGQPD